MGAHILKIHRDEGVDGGRACQAIPPFRGAHSLRKSFCQIGFVATLLESSSWKEKIMATYFKFKLKEGFTAGGSASWGAEIGIPFDGGILRIKTWDGSLDFFFQKQDMPILRECFENRVPGALEPGSYLYNRAGLAGGVAQQDQDVLGRVFRSNWYSLEKLQAGMLMVNIEDRATYSVGGGENEGRITLAKDVWTTYPVLSDQYPYLAFQMTLVNA